MSTPNPCLKGLKVCLAVGASKLIITLHSVEWDWQAFFFFWLAADVEKIAKFPILTEYREYLALKEAINQKYDKDEKL